MLMFNLSCCAQTGYLYMNSKTIAFRQFNDYLVSMAKQRHATKFEEVHKALFVRLVETQGSGFESKSRLLFLIVSCSVNSFA